MRTFRRLSSNSQKTDFYRDQKNQGVGTKLLILDRGKNQNVVVTSPSGEVITFTIISVASYNRVKVGIKAPEKFRIDRDDSEFYLSRKNKGLDNE